MDDKILQLIINRFDSMDKKIDGVDSKVDKVDTKVDNLVEFKHTWSGRIGVFAFVGTVAGSLLLNFLSKKLWG